MIEILADFHTHTTHSPVNHGKGSIEDNVKAAIDRGLRAVAVSDHGVGHIGHGIPDMERYLREIEEIRNKYADQIKVYSGYEANLQSLSGDTDIPDAWAATIDIPSVGAHRFVRHPNPKDWFELTLRPKRRTGSSALAENTSAFVQALTGGPAVFMTHPGYLLPVDVKALAKEAHDGNFFLEINARHPEFTAEEISDAADAGAMFIVNSDAHGPQYVGNFASALERLEKAGVVASQVVNSSENIDEFIEILEKRRSARGPRTFDTVLAEVRGAPSA